MRIVLASASPRRRELLAQIGLDFEVTVSDVEERITAAEPWDVVQELAEQKADAVLETLREEREDREELLVIGADTVVSCDGKILGKPVSEEEAKEMLRMLSGRSHMVYTGVALLFCSGYAGQTDACRKRVFYEATTVRFAKMTAEEIEAYVATGDPMDKAGAYGIQGLCARYIEGIEGDYNNVVGLPVGRLYREAREMMK